MKKLLFFSKVGGSKLIEKDFIPRVGDRVDMFYNPCPTVKEVILWPSEDRLTHLGVVDDVDAIIFMNW